MRLKNGTAEALEFCKPDTGLWLWLKMLLETDSEFFNTYEQKETESQETIGQQKMQNEHQRKAFLH